MSHNTVDQVFFYEVHWVTLLSIHTLKTRIIFELFNNNEKFYLFNYLFVLILKVEES